MTRVSRRGTIAWPCLTRLKKSENPRLMTGAEGILLDEDVCRLVAERSRKVD
jgi:hypothetical protein